MRLWFYLFVAPLICNATELITRATATSQTAAGGSYAPAISPDGRYIAFTSHANNLVTNDNGRFIDLFLHDPAAGETRLISAGAYPSFSANGRWLAYASEVGDMSHVFLYDQQTGSNAHLTAGSLASPNGPAPNGSSRPMLTPDGRWMLFESTATNLVDEPDTNGLPDLFVRDLQSQSNILVSAGAVPRPPRHPYRVYHPARFEASITPDGARVAFVSRNVPAPTTNTTERIEVFVRDLGQNNYHWASTNLEAIVGSATNEYACFNPRLSADGKIVVFKIAPVRGATNGLVLRHDLDTSQTVVIGSDTVPEMPVALSADGRYLAYDSAGQIFRYDAQSGTNELVTVNAAGTAPANGKSQGPVLTPDGQIIAFISSAVDLTPSGNSGGVYQIYVRNLDSGTTRLVSGDVNLQPAARSLATALPALSDDGRRIAFDYSGSDIASNDLNQASDVFIYYDDDRPIGLISRALPASPAITNPRGIAGETNSISADGTKVTFTAPVGTIRQVFVANLTSGAIEQVSTGDPLPADSRGVHGTLSGNGQYCFYLRYTSIRNDPFEGLEGYYRLFRRNLLQGTSEEVPGMTYYAASFVGRAPYPAISDDGNVIVSITSDPSGIGGFGVRYKDMVTGQARVLFGALRQREPTNTRLTPDNRWLLVEHSEPRVLTTNNWTGNLHALFAVDLVGNTNIMISKDANGASLGRAAAESMSASGRYVAYDVYRQFPDPDRTSSYIFDFVTRQNTLLCSNCWDPSLSADARLVAYAGMPPGNSITNIYVKDRVSGTVARIGNSAANASLSRPLLSADGRYVVFSSKASNLVAGDDNGAQDVFLHDRYRGATYRLSAGSALSTRHLISKDGRTVTFQSLAGEMSPGDYNEALDLFYVRLGVGDSDNDGMDDAWEITYFENLDRDGSGDHDGDGHSDFQEFLAGTDPTNTGSVLEVVAIQSLNPNQVRILWSATAGKQYVVQFKASLDAPSWTSTGEPVAADSAVMSIQLAQTSPVGFYRAVLVQ